MIVRKLAGRIHGPLLEPADRDFEEARSAMNGRFDRRPDLIVRCQDADDVRACVAFAREEGLLLSVKGGGHSYAGNTVGDGGLLIDLSSMKAVRVDVGSGTASVQPGVTCGELDRATQAHGLATPLPTVSSVGVVGAALGGGTGYLSRKHGLTLDNLVAVDLVTADGRQIRASEREHSDLFWALRGAGANFGVVTSVQLRLHEVGPEVLGGQIIYPFDDGIELLRFFRDFMADAPDEFQCYPFMIRIPPLDVFPERFHGHPALDFVLYHMDSAASRYVRPLRELGERIFEEVGPTTYVSLQKSFDASLPKGQRYYSKAHYLSDLSEASIDTIATQVPGSQGAFSAAYLEPLGGGIAAVDSSATSFGERDAAYGFHILAGWIDSADDEAVMSWARSFHDAMAFHATGGVYVNLLGEDEEHRIPAAYGENYRRLVELKTEWDPGNLFRMNQNIRPTA
jgi:FAD/FMN-containing dehydrogenase